MNSTMNSRCQTGTEREHFFKIEYNNSYSSGVLDLVNNKAPQSHLRHAEKVSLRFKKVNG